MIFASDFCEAGCQSAEESICKLSLILTVPMIYSRLIAHMAIQMSNKASNPLSKLSILAFLFAAFLIWRVHVAWSDLSANVHMRFFQSIRGFFPSTDQPVEMAKVSIWVLNEPRIVYLFCLLSIICCSLSIVFAMVARFRKESSVLYAGPIVLSLGIIYLASSFISWMPDLYF